MDYLGAKQAAFRHIINQIPPHATYIETHLGTGAVLRNKRPAARNIGIDINPDCLAAVHAAFAGTPETADQAIASAMQPPASSSQLSMLAILGESGESGRHQSPDVAVRAVTGCNGDTFELRHCDAVQFLESYPWKGDEFVYSDPPYLHVTRTGNHRYRHEYTEADHVRLLGVLKGLPCKVMISGYRSELYESLLSGWRVYTYEAMTRGATWRTEYLHMNYPEPTALHDYRWLGNNYRDRENIKRKQKRWRARWQAMDRLERQAILAELQSCMVSPSELAAVSGPARQF